MREEHIKNGSEEQAKAEPPSESKREVSSIQFPYGDLDEAVLLAKAIHEVGGQSCQIEQLAGHLKVAAAGGAFRARLAYPRVFGLVELERGVISLTQLGRSIVDPNQEAAARIDAFLTVPLYKAIYDKYKGYTLPPAAALAREMGALGVSSKQTDKARQVFDRSAKQAGFFWAGNERLTLPVVKSKPETRPIEEHDDKKNEVDRIGGNGGDGGDQHPFISGLLKTLPKPESDWPIAAQAKWLQTAASIFGLIYKAEDGSIKVEIVSH